MALNVVVSTICLALGLGIRHVAVTDPCVCLQTHIGQLEKPMFLAHAIDTGDIDRFFVLEKNGQILEFPGRQSDSETGPYLDISDRLPEDSLANNEYSGLLGLALHPDFVHNWKIYVIYARKIADQLVSAVSEFTGSTKYEADPASERILLTIPLPSSQDHGGHVFFGDDGYLYVSVGDGGREQEDFAQNRMSLLGKILRIDIRGAEAGRNYSIPPDNPYNKPSTTTSRDAGREEIFAVGLRNSWRCSVDSGNVITAKGKGRIFCGDVGEQDFEEINIIVKGGNYGWNKREGLACRPGKNCFDLNPEKLPISVYEHTVTRAAVIGGYVYRGSDLPNLEGQYIFGDTSSGEFFRLTEPPTIGESWPSAVLPVCEPARCPCGAREKQPRHILSFSVDKHEELYVLTADSVVARNAQGTIYKMVSPVSPGKKVTCSGETASGNMAALLWLCLGGWLVAAPWG